MLRRRGEAVAEVGILVTLAEAGRLRQLEHQPPCPVSPIHAVAVNVPPSPLALRAADVKPLFPQHFLFLQHAVRRHRKDHCPAEARRRIRRGDEHGRGGEVEEAEDEHGAAAPFPPLGRAPYREKLRSLPDKERRRGAEALPVSYVFAGGRGRELPDGGVALGGCGPPIRGGHHPARVPRGTRYHESALRLHHWPPGRGSQGGARGGDHLQRHRALAEDALRVILYPDVPALLIVVEPRRRRLLSRCHVPPQRPPGLEGPRRLPQRLREPQCLPVPPHLRAHLIPGMRGVLLIQQQVGCAKLAARGGPLPRDRWSSGSEVRQRSEPPLGFFTGAICEGVNKILLRMRWQINRAPSEQGHDRRRVSAGYHRKLRSWRRHDLAGILQYMENSP
mmetsp:Transcript_67225/g.212885  ORF Transcript_67225/g.212885 Transcript_67225/m.212885 type:complete len:391 (+) Transcript_67225:1170-2342(+)